MMLELKQHILIPMSKKAIGDIKMSSLSEINRKILKKYDACAIITDHSNIDYKFIANNCEITIDTGMPLVITKIKI